MFDFSDESKNKYYDSAEKYLVDAGLSCFKISRDQIRVRPAENEIHVFVVPFSKNTITREQLSAAKKLERFFVINDRYTPKKKGAQEPLRENAYIKFAIDEI